jgi:guanylate kinase
MTKGLLIVVSGPSGVGKGTVIKELFKDETLNLAYSISMTTRLPRDGETNGIDYFFVTKEEFIDKVNKGLLLEHAEFVDNYYGTPKEYVDSLLNEGKNVILEIEVVGAMQVMEKRKEALTIFVAPPSLEELEKRIRGRGTEKEEVVQERLARAKTELTYKNQYQHIVINNTVEQAKEEITHIIRDKLNK